MLDIGEMVSNSPENASKPVLKANRFDVVAAGWTETQINAATELGMTYEEMLALDQEESDQQGADPDPAF